MLSFNSLVKHLIICLFFWSCTSPEPVKNAQHILGNPDYPAISFGGYRNHDRSAAPSVEELKEDLKILDRLGIKVLRTYHARLYDHAPNLLQAISELKDEQDDFEMYVMLGAWIQCKDAWSEQPDHTREDEFNNRAEIEKVIELSNAYPDIVKMIAVGNESMVHWAAGYYVEPSVVLRWVNHLQKLKSLDSLSKDLWITSSDNFASWGGENSNYHKPALDSLINQVDFISVHTYPFHDTHYNPEFWLTPENDEDLSKVQAVRNAMKRCMARAQSQYQAVTYYLDSLNVDKPLHIGETGWASISTDLYGASGSHAADEYKQALYYEFMRNWTDSAGISCFFFEAFNEPWKDGQNPMGSENHFGLFTVDGKAKQVIWNEVDAGTFVGLTRGGNEILKTYGGDSTLLMSSVQIPPLERTYPITKFSYQTDDKKLNENIFSIMPDDESDASQPQAAVNLSSWDGTCFLQYLPDDAAFSIQTGSGDWWGCAVEIKNEFSGEDLSRFKGGTIEFEIKGDSHANFELGFQSGRYAQGTQKSHSIVIGPNKSIRLSNQWEMYQIPVSEFISDTSYLRDITGLVYTRGISNFDGKKILIKNIRWIK